VLDRRSVSPSDGSIPSVCQSSEPEFEAEEVEKDVPGSAGRNTVDDEPPDEPAWLTEAGRCLFEMFASIWPDMARYREIWRDIARYYGILRDITRYCGILRDIVSCGEYRDISRHTPGRSVVWCSSVWCGVV